MKHTLWALVASIPLRPGTGREDKSSEAKRPPASSSRDGRTEAKTGLPRLGYMRLDWNEGMGYWGFEWMDGDRPSGNVGCWRGWMSPEAPAPFGVLLAKNLFLALSLFLRTEVAVFLLQEPNRGPAMLLKVFLIFWKNKWEDENYFLVQYLCLVFVFSKNI